MMTNYVIIPLKGAMKHFSTNYSKTPGISHYFVQVWLNCATSNRSTQAQLMGHKITYRVCNVQIPYG